MASSPVWVVWIIFSLEFLPIIQAGSKELANSDFVCLGGILTINLLSLPVAISLNFFATILWCLPSMNSGQMCLVKLKKSFRIFKIFFQGNGLGQAA